MAEYVAQKQIFEELATEHNLVEIQGFEPNISDQGCIALTLNGSVLNLSPILDQKGMREFSYLKMPSRKSVPTGDKIKKGIINQPLITGFPAYLLGLTTSRLIKIYSVSKEEEHVARAISTLISRG